MYASENQSKDASHQKSRTVPDDAMMGSFSLSLLSIVHQQPSRRERRTLRM